MSLLLLLDSGPIWFGYVADLILAIATALGAAPSLLRTQYAGALAAGTRLTEGMQDYPTLQIYPEANTTTDWTGETDRISLSGKHSVKEYVIHADLLARPRSHIDEDMAQVVISANELEDILDTMTYPLFARAYILSFQWSWHWVVFSYAGVKYAGARFVLTIRAVMEIW